MDKGCMARMSAAELDEYGEILGVSTAPAKTADEKMRLIERRRARTASVRALGLDLEVPVKRARDKRASDLMAKADITDAEVEEVMRILLGDEQMADVERACTDEDGTVDVDAMALAFAKLVTSDELKNF
ncbi:hypothetical protein FIC87_11340 [Eggerthella lenta]|uniref:Uncharacterized protein n=1 Tax=Eggerthella lenta TaxID=84112 RepID=A0A5C5BSX2_EGGLN|nr:hypothetical protein [Eggerthella lenta]TNU89385.1 hypothetical protein FIC87_11340 [Eggerthella lenta]